MTPSITGSLIAFQVFVFTIYILYIIERFGVLESISESWYKLGKHNYLFTLFSWGVGFPMVMVGENVFFFLSTFGMLLLGAAGRFKKKYIEPVHYIGAVSAISFGFIGIWVKFGAWWWMVMYVVACLFLKYLWPNRESRPSYLYSINTVLAEEHVIFGEIPNFIWWIEILAFFLVMSGIVLG